MVKMNDIKIKLESFCFEFYHYILSIKNNNTNSQFISSFPNGVCSDASNLICCLIFEHFGMIPQLIDVSIKNEQFKNYTHKSLLIDDYIIDITILQFSQQLKFIFTHDEYLEFGEFTLSEEQDFNEHLQHSIFDKSTFTYIINNFKK